MFVHVYFQAQILNVFSESRFICFVRIHFKSHFSKTKLLGSLHPAVFHHFPAWWELAGQHCHTAGLPVRVKARPSPVPGPGHPCWHSPTHGKGDPHGWYREGHPADRRLAQGSTHGSGVLGSQGKPRHTAGYHTLPGQGGTARHWAALGEWSHALHPEGLLTTYLVLRDDHFVHFSRAPIVPSPVHSGLSPVLALEATCSHEGAPVRQGVPQLNCAGATLAFCLFGTPRGVTGTRKLLKRAGAFLASGAPGMPQGSVGAVPGSRDLAWALRVFSFCSHPFSGCFCFQKVQRLQCDSDITDRTEI